jgi:hypothetical protein
MTNGANIKNTSLEAYSWLFIYKQIQDQSLFSIYYYLSINLSWMDLSTYHEYDTCKRKIFILNGDKHKTNSKEIINNTSNMKAIRVSDR